MDNSILAESRMTKKQVLKTAGSIIKKHIGLLILILVLIVALMAGYSYSMFMSIGDLNLFDEEFIAESNRIIENPEQAEDIFASLYENENVMKMISAMSAMMSKIFLFGILFTVLMLFVINTVHSASADHLLQIDGGTGSILKKAFVRMPMSLLGFLIMYGISICIVIASYILMIPGLIIFGISIFSSIDTIAMTETIPVGLILFFIYMTAIYITAILVYIRLTFYTIPGIVIKSLNAGEAFGRGIKVFKRNKRATWGIILRVLIPVLIYTVLITVSAVLMPEYIIITMIVLSILYLLTYYIYFAYMFVGSAVIYINDDILEWQANSAQAQQQHVNPVIAENQKVNNTDN